MAFSSRSIVKYLFEDDKAPGHSCGYCGTSGSCTNGMWAYQLTCQDYEDLIDRGWRRSGQYVYKFKMQRTCCPAYTIRCDATQFKATKSQKKVMKKMTKYLTEEGKKRTDGEASAKKGDDSHTAAAKEVEPSTARLPPRKGSGPDPNKPVCEKAKVLRQRRKEERLAARGDERPVDQSAAAAEQAAGVGDGSKTIEEFIVDKLPGKPPVHNFEIRLVRSDPKDAEFKATLKKSLKLYQKYQQAVHKDKPGSCTQDQWENFLVRSPLIAEHTAGGPAHGYGSFHQQYYLDGKLIAVGVVDILPHCTSSVYVYYDPDLPELSLGTYSALREIYFTRQLHAMTPAIKWYYMGFYIHTCQKMKYKGNYQPSFLVCPERYTWVPIEECKPKLDLSPYSRLDTSSKPEPVEDIQRAMDKVPILVDRGQFMKYQDLKQVLEDEDKALIRQYTTLAGKVSSRMLLSV